MKSKWLVVAAVSLFVLGVSATACDKNSGGKESAKAKSAGTKKDDQKEGSAKEKDKQKEQAQKKDSDARTVNIESVGNEFKFKQTEIKAKPGEKLHIVFKNTADQKSVKHNFLQLDTNKDEEAKKVAQAGLKAADNDYVPKKGKAADHVIANSPLAGPGETVEFTFKVPDEPGKYKYICTFPGHYPKMQGTLIVEK